MYFVRGIGKKRALNQNKNTNIMLAEMLEIVLTPKILRPPKIGGPRRKPFQPNGKPAPACWAYSKLLVLLLKCSKFA